MSNFTAPTLSRHGHVVRRTIAVVVDASSRSKDPLGSVAGLSVSPSAENRDESCPRTSAAALIASQFPLLQRKKSPAGCPPHVAQL